MLENNFGNIKPKDILRSLKIYRSLVKKQMTYFPLSFTGLRIKSKELIALLDLYINDYQDFFKKKAIEANTKQEQLFFEDNTHN